MLYAVLRKAHTVFAYLFMLMILAHVGAILFHTLIVRDGMLTRMVPWNVRPPMPGAVAPRDAADPPDAGPPVAKRPSEV
jgi:cytochrome b561